jgi:hypothetical protein
MSITDPQIRQKSYRSTSMASQSLDVTMISYHGYARCMRVRRAGLEAALEFASPACHSLGLVGHIPIDLASRFLSKFKC